MSYIVVGVRFKQAGKIYFFDPVGLELKPGDYVIVETARGLEHGQVMVAPREVADDKVTLPLKNVIRVASDQDQVQLADNKDREKKALAICQEKVNYHQLEMKLVDVEYTFDRSKIIFYFTADGRVDFRELVKDLAAVFRTRIELRQIGVRDEAKMLGGLGPCGRPLCCATFLGDFEPVSIKMAKEQNLSLNPVKISGICSRLMCCLKYESSCYRETKSDIPLVGGKIRFDGREGKIIANNQLKESLLVDFGGGDQREVLLSEVEEIILDEIGAGCKNNCKCNLQTEEQTVPSDGQQPESEKVPPDNQPDQLNNQPNGQTKNRHHQLQSGQLPNQPNNRSQQPKHQQGRQPKGQNNQQQGGHQKGQNNQPQGGRPKGQNNQQQGGHQKGQNNQQQGGHQKGQNNQQQGGRPKGQNNQQQGGRPKGQNNQQPSGQPKNQNNQQQNRKSKNQSDNIHNNPK
jgi:cell fate regulator YaaT (PSP1 superfamily)